MPAACKKWMAVCVARNCTTTTIMGQETDKESQTESCSAAVDSPRVTADRSAGLFSRGSLSINGDLADEAVASISELQLIL